jgi:hypothetical protein
MTDERRTVDRNPFGIGMEIAKEEKNLEWSIINGRSNRKGKRTSPDREENFSTDAELINSQVYKDLEKEYTQGNLPNKTKPNSSRTDLTVSNKVEVNVVKGTEDNQEDSARPDKRNVETGKEPRREASQKYDF